MYKRQVLMRSPVSRSGELPVIISYHYIIFARCLACDPKGNISKTLVCACTDCYTLNISTLNLIVDRYDSVLLQSSQWQEYLHRHVCQLLL